MEGVLEPPGEQCPICLKVGEGGGIGRGDPCLSGETIGCAPVGFREGVPRPGEEVDGASWCLDRLVTEWNGQHALDARREGDPAEALPPGLGVHRVDLDGLAIPHGRQTGALVEVVLLGIKLGDRDLTRRLEGRLGHLTRRLEGRPRVARRGSAGRAAGLRDGDGCGVCLRQQLCGKPGDPDQGAAERLLFQEHARQRRHAVRQLVLTQTRPYVSAQSAPSALPAYRSDGSAANVA